MQLQVLCEQLQETAGVSLPSQQRQHQQDLSLSQQQVEQIQQCHSQDAAGGAAAGQQQQQQQEAVMQVLRSDNHTAAPPAAHGGIGQSVSVLDMLRHAAFRTTHLHTD
jgi:hypothetical protein